MGIASTTPRINSIEVKKAGRGIRSRESTLNELGKSGLELRQCEAEPTPRSFSGNVARHNMRGANRHQADRSSISDGSIMLGPSDARFRSP
jgi:hypothetical protein